MDKKRHVELKDYIEKAEGVTVFSLNAKASFSPVDINIAFLMKDGWSASSDRLRFHVHNGLQAASDHPLAKLLGSMEPNLLIRRHDREEDCMAVIRIHLDGTIHILSNDSEYANRYLRGVFLEMPPSFHGQDSVTQTEEWTSDKFVVPMFCGLVAGAFGWDSAHDLPPALETSLEEAKKALEIANYRSCVVMCRRSIEALLKFAFPRLLGRQPVDNRGRDLLLNSLIQEFRNANPSKIPAHLLHVADALRVLGNVPGAHAAEIENYRFSRFDAEFAIGTVGYFVDQYFSKIDSEVARCYPLTIDLSDQTSASGSA